MTDDGSTERKLKPGPGHSPDEVRASQLARLHRAMIALVDEVSYERVTVRMLAHRAEVSSRTFYEHFKGKQECLLGTSAAIMRRVARRVLEEARAAEDPRDRLRLGLRAFAEQLAADPPAGRLALVEVSAAGLAFVERRTEMATPFEEKLAACIARNSAGNASPLVVEAIAAGVLHVAQARLFDGREAELPGLADRLHAWLMLVTSRADANLQAPAPGGGSSLDRSSELIAGRRRPHHGGRDRDLLLSSALKLAARHGYWRISGATVSADAGLSPSKFAAHFPDPTACFLACQQLLTERVLALAEEERARVDDWAEGVHRAIAVLTTSIAADPGLARLAFLDTFAPGVAGLRERERLLGVIGERFLASAPPALRPEPIAAEASLGAIWRMIHHCVAAGRLRDLPAHAPFLSYLALAPAIGPSGTVDLITGSGTGGRG